MPIRPPRGRSRRRPVAAPPGHASEKAVARRQLDPPEQHGENKRAESARQKSDRSFLIGNSAGEGIPTDAIFEEDK